MIKNIFSAFLVSLVPCATEVFSQNNFPCWTEYAHDRDAISVTYAKNNIWVGTNKALIRLDPDTKAVLERIDEFNPRFPIYSGTLATDPNDNLWIGGRGLGKYDGNNFTVFNRANSPLITPNGYDVGINTIKPDAQGRIWLATGHGGFMFDGNQSWVKYDTATTDIPFPEVLDIQPDAQGNVWFTFGNLHMTIPNNCCAMKMANGRFSTRATSRSSAFQECCPTSGAVYL